MKISVWFFLLSCLLCELGNAQYVFLPALDREQEGMIIGPAGDVVAHIPPGWRLPKDGHRPNVIENWPLIFFNRGYQRPIQYAWLTEDLQWKVHEGYREIWPAQHGLYRRKKERLVELAHLDRSVFLDSFQVLGPFLDNGVAVAEPRPDPETGNRRWGLLDTSSNWHWEPHFQRIAYHQHDRFMVMNQDGESALLTLEGDTIVPFGFTDWKLEWDTPFDETGHAPVTISKDLLGVINIQGELVADSIDKNYGVFHNGVFRQIIDNKYRYVGYDGTILNETLWPNAVNYSYNRGLVEDPVSLHLGYLNLAGEWAIPANYCYASSFFRGIAVVCRRQPEDCQRPKHLSESSSTSSPSSIGGYDRQELFEIIDTSGQVLWEGIANSVTLIDSNLIWVTQCHVPHSPGFYLYNLTSGETWYHPRYTITYWDNEIGTVPYDKVYGINLGVWNSVVILHQHFDLPANFMAEVHQMTQLQVLNLRGHRTADILEEIAGLENLRSLNLSRCDLSEIPARIRRLHQLEHLDLSDNRLTGLPKAIFRMQHLQSLNVEGNDFPTDLIPRLQAALPNTEVIYK